MPLLGMAYAICSLASPGAILLFPDTTQDADVFLDKTMANGRCRGHCTVRNSGLVLTEQQANEIIRRQGTSSRSRAARSIWI
jgi:hypothetical protein